MQDLYGRLGLSKTASQAEIKSAYRKLAKRYHPDLNPGDSAAEQRFKEATQAYDILSDTQKRRKYDAGEIDADGQPRHPFGAGFRSRAHEAYSRHGSARPSGRGPQGAEEMNAEDIFADLFGGGFGRAGAGPGSGQGGGSGFGGFAGGFGRRSGARVHADGADISYDLTVSFLDAATGATKRVRLADGKTLDVTIPAGTEDGQTLRLRGQGMAGMGSGKPGDALVTVRVQADARFQREGKDITSRLPISLQEAVLGASVPVETIHGTVSVKVPAGSNSGRRLRLKGRGIKPRNGEPGDHYVTLEVRLPETIDPEFKQFVESWSRSHGYDPRKR